MTMANKDAGRIIAEAEQLIGEIQRQLESGDDPLRSQGVDTERMRSTIAAALGSGEREEAARLVREDLIAVDQEVAEARTRLAFSSPAGSPRHGLRRNLV